MIGAYALSESGSGSDALSARTRAERQPDGSFVLNGEKMWITNGGFADLFIVFAKVLDGSETGQFTAFIVERAFPGVSGGKEEHKMGLHGSSTTPLILQDARVPAGNVLGEIGKGHKVAFNVLNYGRFKLAAMCSGGARRVIGESASYAAERRQFGQPIATFGAIRHKLAEMVIREYAVEAMLYRTAGLIDSSLQGSHASDAVLAALEEFAIEASILKVASSEMIDFVVDENVQIHGGNGFVHDYPAEGQYRDARVNRIFEGTNEINRLLIPGMLARRAVKGGLPLIAAARRLQDDLLTPMPAAAVGDAALDAAQAAVTAMKKVALMVLGTAMQTYGARLADEQEVLTRAADIIIDVYASDSARASGRGCRRSAARGGRLCLRQRRRRPRRAGRTRRARGDGRRGHAAHDARRPEAADENDARQYRRPAPPDRGCGRGAPRISFLTACVAFSTSSLSCCRWSRSAAPALRSATRKRSPRGERKRIASCGSPASRRCRPTSARRSPRSPTIRLTSSTAPPPA